MANDVMSKSKRESIMKSIEKRRDVLRTQVRSVAQGYTTALFVYGPGGLGKTHIITEEMDALCGKAWAHHTAGSTSHGLFQSLAEAKDQVHVYEDCEKLYKTDFSASILRAACGGARGQERWVTYETANEKYRFRFTGGVIIVSNENISRAKGPLAAVASRFRPVKWDMSIEERVAVILDMADEGWERGGHKLEPLHCRLVAKFLIEEMATTLTAAGVDLRMYAEHGLPAYAQWSENKEGPHWKDIIRAKLTGEVAKDVPRSDKTKQLEDLAYIISTRTELTDTKSRIAAWTAKTGLGQAIYYRHLKAYHSKNSTPS